MDNPDEPSDNERESFEIEPFDEYIFLTDPIPEMLHSVYEEGPFTRCVDCNAELDACEEGYVIQKAVRQGEVIFEFALCAPCHLKLIAEFSEETRERLDAHFAAHVSEAAGLNSCMICGMPQHDILEYNVGGVCAEQFLVHGYLLCIDCALEANGLMSQKTRDRWDRFVGQNFPGVPADQQRPVFCLSGFRNSGTSKHVFLATESKAFSGAVEFYPGINMETVEEILDYASDKMGKAVEFLQNEFNGLRSGKASPAMVENITIDYYGTPTRLRDLSNISTPEARLLAITPFDPSVMAAIEKAILEANIGVTPVNDGKLIRIPIPELSEERRNELVKVARRETEEQRVAVRNVRREANDQVKALQKDGKITEDERDHALEQVQKKTDEHIKNIDDMLARKEEEVSEV